MAKRKKIALLFSYNENWIGGTYYIQNIVHALSILPDEMKPDITVCTEDEHHFEYLKRETNYPYFHLFVMKRTFRRLPLFKRTINSLLRLLGAHEYFYQVPNDCRLNNEFDFVFPNPDGYFFDKIDNDKKGYWIPDFQDIHFPELFVSSDLLLFRKQNHLRMALTANKLVLSSKAAFSDFNTYYPFATSQMYVLPFAVTHPYFEDIEIESLKKKYSITQDYYYAPNQFWKHKNHITVAKAVVELKKRNKDVLILFSGKETDYRSEEHLYELKKFIEDNHLSNNILFLGFLDRHEQLLLMKYARSIIQPSLFEGWSTVIEDAKAMNQFVIASSLAVHLEQLDKYKALFFSPLNHTELADKILEFEKTENRDINKIEYKDSIREFALNFIKIFSDNK